MKHTNLYSTRAVLLTVICLAQIFLASAQDPLTLERIFGSAEFFPKNPSDMQMYPQEGYYTTVETTSKHHASVIIRHTFEKDIKDTIFNSATAGLAEAYALEGYKISDSKRYILLSANSNHIYRHSNEAEYCIYDATLKKISRINEGKKVFYATLSPDEKKVAFVYGNNLYIQDIQSNKISQITADGELNHILNGKSDWVYEEEFVVVQAFSWSPKGDKLAFYRFDESNVKEVELPRYDSSYFTQYRYKYPKAGEDNSKVSIWIYDLASAKSKKLDLREENDQYIPRIKWTSDNNILAIERMNRLQNKLELLEANASTGALTTIYTETSNTYIDITDDLYFLKDNSFLITSEKDGYNHIYYYNSQGQLIKKLTSSSYDVSDIIALDEKTGTVYYKASDPGALVKFLYSIKLDGSHKKPLVENQQGQNSASFSKDFKYFILNNSSSDNPPNWTIYSMQGRKIRGLEDNSSLKRKIDEYRIKPKEFIKIPISDSIYLNAFIIRPPDFIEGKKYPVLFHIYGGPGNQMVFNGWDRFEMWYRYLAANGLIVVCVDNRGTGGRGADFKKLTYRKLGQLESDDQITAAHWLAKQSYVDGNRIGMFGWSFGGYMSSMCITKGADIFKAAVAVAPVTDWRYYDNIYTERYMQRPVDNIQNYDDGSVKKYVGNLKGKFLLIHGTFDDNVHPQNSFMLINEMIKQNKKYDSEFYPNKNHGISGGVTRLHLFERITDFILQNL